MDTPVPTVPITLTEFAGKGDAAFERHLESAGLDTREEMLRTLHLAYSDTLDDSARSIHRQIHAETLPPEHCRLTSAQQYDLGRRLALYWDLGCDTLPKPERPAYWNHGDEIEAVLAGIRQAKSGEATT